MTTPRDLAAYKPILSAHAALAIGRHSAAVALREVLRELYPAALRAYPDPAEPVALAVLDALPEPGLLGAPTTARGRDAVVAADAVVAQLSEDGIAEPAIIAEAVTALRVAIADTPRRGGVNRALASAAAEAVRHAVAAVSACDAACTALVATLADRMPTPSANPTRRAARRAVGTASPASAPPGGPLRAVPPVGDQPRIPGQRRGRPQPAVASAPVIPRPMVPPPVAPAPVAPAPHAPAAQSHPTPPAAPPQHMPRTEPAPAAARVAAVHPVSGHPTSGHPTSGYPVSGYPVSGHPVSGYPVSVEPASTRPAHGHGPVSGGPTFASPTPPGVYNAAIPSAAFGHAAVPVPPPATATPAAPAAHAGPFAPATPAAWAAPPVPPLAERTVPPVPPMPSAPPAPPPLAEHVASHPERVASHAERAASPGPTTYGQPTALPAPNRPVSVPPPPPPGITPIAPAQRGAVPPAQAGEPFRPTLTAAAVNSARAARAAHRSADPPRSEDAAVSGLRPTDVTVSVPPPRPSSGAPAGSRANWPLVGQGDDPGGPASGYDFERPPSEPDLPSEPADKPGRVTPPWLADDLPPEPPTLRLVEPPPLADRALREDLTPLDDLRFGPPPLRLVESGPAERNGHGPGRHDVAERPVSAPVSDEGDGDLLIFAATRSAWFTGHPEDETNLDWASSADTGWQAAERVARPAVGAETGAGLPRRVPQANLVPGSPLRDERPLRIVRDAASIAAHTTGYFRGWRRGQEIGGYAVGGRPGRDSAGGWDFSRESETRERDAQEYEYRSAGYRS
jgi:hypothetical protein